jgi:glutathione synthase/RimK-type ligase-like ATP-grasp enzyme
VLVVEDHDKHTTKAKQVQLSRVGFATYAQALELTADDKMAIVPLQQRGIEVVPFDWQAETGLPHGLDAIVLRSCWNYHLERTAFEAWLQQLDAQNVPVLNPPAVARWNLHKSYLQELTENGVRVPHTVWVQAGQKPDLASLLLDNDLDQVVIKPAVSATAYRTWRTSRLLAPTQQTEFEALSATHDVLIQAFMPEVLATGEVSLVFFQGEFSHAIRKRPKQGDFRVQQDFGGTREAFRPSASLIEQARLIAQHVSSPLLYARVDGVEVGETLVLMELEVIDPELYFLVAPHGVERFANALARVLGEF